jgi:esterase
MKLYFKKTGEGKPLLILHGLFGLGDNWQTQSKLFAENGFCCYQVDLRNHGRSPHSMEFTYELMADDLQELMYDEKIEKADLIGHSMGGKVAMFLAIKHPERIEKMIIADMAPRYYPQHHQSVFSALNSFDPESLSTRKEAEEKLRLALKDESTIQFLLKNLYWKEENKLGWRFGLNEIEKNIEEVGKGIPENSKIDMPVLFLRGERSGYINEQDEIEIKKIFSSAEVRTISNAGHWVHAENPKGFFDEALTFLKK